MILREPSYFKEFSCLAAACPDSCCKEWEVQVDEVTASAYLSMDGALGEDLRHYLYQDEQKDWYLRITQGRCPMWRQDGLCRIQVECGHDALCKTCQEFPRLTHEYGSFAERGLELSCPAAAKLILEAADCAWVEQDLPDGEPPDYDPADMNILLKTREKMLSILADTSRPVPEVLALGLLFGYHSQSLLDGEDVRWKAEDALNFGREIAKGGDIAEITAFFQKLEILTEQWQQRLEKPQGTGEWNSMHLRLMRYGVERYWLQAISDFDLVGRVKMMLLSCLMVRHLGGDFIQTAQLYSKEIENNAENVEAILEGAYSHPALTDDRLLGLLLKNEKTL